jgi:hypothetical protein
VSWATARATRQFVLVNCAVELSLFFCTCWYVGKTCHVIVKGGQNLCFARRESVPVASHNSRLPLIWGASPDSFTHLSFFLVLLSAGRTTILLATDTVTRSGVRLNSIVAASYSELLYGEGGVEP